MSTHFRRGAEAIAQAVGQKKSKSFSFVPKLEWRKDGDSKYVLVLTPISEVYKFDVHEWVPVGKGERSDGSTYTKYEQFINRKDPSVGEDYDDLEDRLGWSSKTRCLGIGIELEPYMELRQGRHRPKGFTVKTESLIRMINGERKEVEVPAIGVIQQSAFLVWGPLANLDETVESLAQLPLEITRSHTGDMPQYIMTPFMDKPVDLAPLIETVQNIGFLEENMDDVLRAMDAADDDLHRSQAIADALLSKWVNVLMDRDRYDELVGPIEEGSIRQRFAGNVRSKPRVTRSHERRQPEPQTEETAAPIEQDKMRAFQKLRAEAGL